MSLYRDAGAKCPRCAVDLEHEGPNHGCKTCGGLWLDEGRLDEMLREMHGQPVAPVFALRAGAELASCPSCGAPMKPVVLEGIALDRCERKHGVWFDADELEATLRAAAAAEVAVPGHGAPNVRIGLGRAILSGFGGFLKLLGWGIGGTIGMIGIIVAPSRHRPR